GGVAAAGLLATAPSPSPITATTVLICTVLPASTLISESVPLAGEGISASTLSVEISNSGSSRWTLSPGFFSHFVIVPSKIDSPIWGMMTSVGISSFRTAHGYEFRARHKSLLYKEAGARRQVCPWGSVTSLSPAVQCL